MLYIQFIVRLVTRNMLARLSCGRLEFGKKEHEDAIRLGQEKKSAIAEKDKRGDTHRAKKPKDQ